MMIGQYNQLRQTIFMLYSIKCRPSKTTMESKSQKDKPTIAIFEQDHANFNTPIIFNI